MTSAPASASTARGDRSPRLPIGVPTRTMRAPSWPRSPPASSPGVGPDAHDLPARVSRRSLSSSRSSPRFHRSPQLQRVAHRQAPPLEGAGLAPRSPSGAPRGARLIRQGRSLVHPAPPPAPCRRRRRRSGTACRRCARTGSGQHHGAPRSRPARAGPWPDRPKLAGHLGRGQHVAVPQQPGHRRPTDGSTRWPPSRPSSISELCRNEPTSASSGPRRRPTTARSRTAVGAEPSPAARLGSDAIRPR